MAIFNLLARLGLDTTDFQTGIKKAQSGAASLGGSMRKHIQGELGSVGSAVAGMFTVGAVRGFVGELGNIVGEIKDVADLLDISTDEVQRLQKAASEAGQPFSAIVTAFQRIEALRAKALTGDEKAGGIFAMLGIDPSKGSGVEIMRQAVEASKAGVHQNAAAFELLGKKVGNLKLVMQELQNLGPIKIISEDQLNAIDVAGKKMEEAKRQLVAASAGPLVTMMQGATGMLNMFNPNTETVSAADVGIAKAIELNAASFLGMRNDEGRKYDALPLPERSSRTASVEDPSVLLRRIADSNEKTMNAIISNTQR